VRGIIGAAAVVTEIAPAVARAVTAVMPAQARAVTPITERRRTLAAWSRAPWGEAMSRQMKSPAGCD
jgi:hypothetical protein